MRKENDKACGSSEALQFRGTGVAMATPFGESGVIDYLSLERLLATFIDAELDNIILFGTTGESPTIDKREKEEVIRFVKERLAPLSTKLVVGLASNNTAHLVEIISSFDFTGIDGILTSTPYYNKPSQEGLYQHFAALATIAPRPIIVYNIPGRTGCDLLPSTLLRLRKDFPTKIVAVKESTGKVERVQELVRIMDSQFTILSGDDCHTVDFIKEGAHGAISVVANAYPRLIKRIIDETLSGDELDKAHAEVLNVACNELYHVLFEDGNPSGIKSLLKLMGVFETERLRLPLVTACEETRQHILEVYKKLQEAIASDFGRV